MGRGRKILSLAMCGVLALTLGACGSGAKSGDDSSSSTLFEKKPVASDHELHKGTSLTRFNKAMKARTGEDDFLDGIDNKIDAFTYDEPQGWEKETTDHYIVYKKIDGKDLQAIIVIGQYNKNLAKSGKDIDFIEGSSYTGALGGFALWNECDSSITSNDKAFYSTDSLPLDASKCYIDGCSVRACDLELNGQPVFGSCKGSVLSVGTADAALSAVLIASDSSYHEAKGTFEKFEASVHASAGELEKMKQVIGTAPTVGNSFADRSLYKSESNATNGTSTTQNNSETTNAQDVADSSTNQYGDGMYKVGTDIPAGEYKLTASGGTSGYWQVTNSSDADADIVGNDNFDGSAYVTVKDGQYLKLERCTAVATGK